MDAALLRGLALGDVVEWGELFPGMSDEPICWLLKSVPKGSRKTFEFEVTWHGIKIGKYFAKIQPSEDISWVKS